MSESQLNSRDITFRTVFHDVEGIKAYLRKLRHENERVMKNINGVVEDVVNKVINDSEQLYVIVSGMVNSAVSPLQTEWVNDEFADYIGENISDITVNLISDRFMSIVDYNSEQFNAYINSALTTDAVEAFVSQLKTEWVNDDFIDYIGNNLSASTVNLISDRFMSIVEYNSGELNAYINSALTSNTIEAFVSQLKTEWVSSYFISFIADQFTKTDIKNILKNYHVIEKFSTTLNPSIVISMNEDYKLADALKRFRILAYISGDKATDNLHYTYTSTAIFEDAYTLISGETILNATQLIIANITAVSGDLGINFNTDTNNVDYNSYLGGTLWYGFTDLIDPNTQQP